MNNYHIFNNKSTDINSNYNDNCEFNINNNIESDVDFDSNSNCDLEIDSNNIINSFPK